MNVLSDRIRTDRKTLMEATSKLAGIATTDPEKLKAKEPQINAAFIQCTNLIHQFRMYIEQYTELEKQVDLKTYQVAPSLLRSRNGRRSSLNHLLYNGSLKPTLTAGIIARMNSKPYVSLGFYIQQMYIAMKDLVVARLCVCFRYVDRVMQADEV